MIKRHMAFALIACVSLCSKRGSSQQISGISFVQDIPATTLPTIHRHPEEIQSYHDTSEDYIAAYYYDVATSGGLFFGSNPAASQSGQATGNPDAGGYLQVVNATPGVWSESTYHYVVAFYVAGYGYYDPYGFSNGAYCPECGQNNGYWFYANVAIYIISASILLGQTFGTSTHNPPQTYVPGGPVTAIYQSFIPPLLVEGPPDPGVPYCLNLEYQGDNRSAAAPTGGATYRAAQFITLTPAGPSGSIPFSNVPNTGITFQFASDILLLPLVNGRINPKAYDELHDCHWLNDVGKATTSTLPVSPGTSSGGSANVVLSGSAANPLSWPQVLTPSIKWNFNLTVTPDNTATGNFTRNFVKYSFTYSHTCYPAHELDIDGISLYLYSPTGNDLTTITGCLTGLFPAIKGTKSGSLTYSTLTAGG